MKILLDPTLTSVPSKCSVTIQFYEFVRRTLFVENRQDVWFYWIVPEHVTPEEFEWYPKHERIRYVRMARSRDRIRDYLTPTEDMLEAVAFNGSLWDFDVLLTVRAGLIPTFLAHMNSPRARKLAWTKQVWLIEDMPMMTFKPSTLTTIPDVQDRWTLEGHIAADHSWVCSYHESPDMIREARRWFAPSVVIGLNQKLQPVIPAQFERYELKTPDQMFVPGGTQRFGLAYIGRMEKANKIVDINDLMLKMWIPRGSKVNLLVCTVSKVIKTFDEDLMDVRQPGREEFWRIVQEEMHAFVKMPMSSGFSLSLIEPIMLGTPVVTLRSDANVSMLGADYPFFADGPSTMPGILKALYDDYATHYEVFARWHREWFEPTYRRRMVDDLLYPKLSAAIDSYQSMMETRKVEVPSLEWNDVTTRLADLLGTEVKGKEVRTIFEGVRAMGGLGELNGLGRKLKASDRLERSIAFSTPWNQFRLGLKLFHGFEDASTEVGHLRRI